MLAHRFIIEDHVGRKEPGGRFSMRENYLQLASPGLLNYLVSTTQAHLTKGGTAHCGQGPPASIGNQEMTHRCAHGPT